MVTVRFTDTGRGYTLPYSPAVRMRITEHEKNEQQNKWYQCKNNSDDDGTPSRMADMHPKMFRNKMALPFLAQHLPAEMANPVRNPVIKHVAFKIPFQASSFLSPAIPVTVCQLKKPEFGNIKLRRRLQHKFAILGKGSIYFHLDRTKAIEQYRMPLFNHMEVIRS